MADEGEGGRAEGAGDSWSKKTPEKLAGPEHLGPKGCSQCVDFLLGTM